MSSCHHAPSGDWHGGRRGTTFCHGSTGKPMDTWFMLNVLEDVPRQKLHVLQLQQYLRGGGQRRGTVPPWLPNSRRTL